MNKFNSLTLILSLIFFLICSNLFMTVSSFAESETNLNLHRKNLITIAKGAAALYLLSRLNTLIMDQKQKNLESRENNTGRLSSVRSSSHIDDKIIVIDPGHGGYDPGAVGTGGLEEKTVNLDIGIKLYNLLKQNTEAEVYLTRDDDRFISLQERAALANRLNADVFISIHSNADKAGIENGIETYAHYNAPRNTWALAWYLHENLVKELSLKDRGLKANNFHVIRETTNMNSLLLEIGYISHNREEALLSSVNFREKAVKAIYEGILDYYSAI